MLKIEDLEKAILKTDIREQDKEASKQSGKDQGFKELFDAECDRLRKEEHERL